MTEEQPKPKRIYLAGNWLDPPLYVADVLEDAGYAVPFKWWLPRERERCYGNMQYWRSCVEDCDAFVVMHCPERDAGSCMGLGVALAHRKPCFYFHKKDQLPPSALMNGFCVLGEERLIKSLNAVFGATPESPK